MHILNIFGFSDTLPTDRIGKALVWEECLRFGLARIVYVPPLPDPASTPFAYTDSEVSRYLLLVKFQFLNYIQNPFASKSFILGNISELRSRVSSQFISTQTSNHGRRLKACHGPSLTIC
jgi:hypothetical protein